LLRSVSDKGGATLAWRVVVCLPNKQVDHEAFTDVNAMASLDTLTDWMEMAEARVVAKSS